MMKEMRLFYLRKQIPSDFFAKEIMFVESLKVFELKGINLKSLCLELQKFFEKLV
jgi:hypothetical protein